MAKVFADDVSLEFYSDEPLVAYVDHVLIDDADNGNGRIDPGEQVELQLSLKNFGTQAQDVSLELTSDDSQILIYDGTAAYGDLAPGETATNGEDPLVLIAPLLARSGHIVELNAVVSHAGGETVSRFWICIGKYSFLVWDPTGDQSSGPVLRETLESIGYQGGYRQSIEYVDLSLYASLFVTLGVYPNTFRIAEDALEASMLVEYLDQGGRLYLEGGDTWVYDPQNGGFDFGPYFKIVPMADGSPDLGTVKGRAGTIGDGMRFPYGGENQYIDHINRNGAGVIVFENESPPYITGVSYDSGLYRTLGVSFEFAGLADGDPPSTRAQLARSIIEYFLPPQTQGVPGPAPPAPLRLALATGPQPCRDETTLSFTLDRELPLEIGLYDILGRRLRELAAGPRPEGEYSLTVARGNLAPGIYFVRARAGEASLSRRLVWVD